MLLNSDCVSLLLPFFSQNCVVFSGFPTEGKIITRQIYGSSSQVRQMATYYHEERAEMSFRQRKFAI